MIFIGREWVNFFILKKNRNGIDCTKYSKIIVLLLSASQYKKLRRSIVYSQTYTYCTNSKDPSSYFDSPLLSPIRFHIAAYYYSNSQCRLYPHSLNKTQNKNTELPAHSTKVDNCRLGPQVTITYYYYTVQVKVVKLISFLCCFYPPKPTSALSKIVKTYIMNKCSWL